MGESLKKKVDEETAEVFSWVVQSVIDDMKIVIEQLRKQQDTGEYTQSIQKDIERKLKELVDSMKKERARRKQQGGGQGGGGGKMKPRLIPRLAEIKMLKQMQINLKRKTEEFHRINIKKNIEGLDEIQKTILQRLGAEQGNLADLTQKLLKAIEDDMSGGGKPKEEKKE
jgi:hypothetical protein